ncbi:hypothetical protein EZS27_042159, partial [termite gut metagenome]
MNNFDPNKLTKLHNFNDILDQKYGKEGTETRAAFHEKSMAWYYGDILRDRRKELKLTQQQLAEKVGKERKDIDLLKQSERKRLKEENKWDTVETLADRLIHQQEITELFI